MTNSNQIDSLPNDDRRWTPSYGAWRHGGWYVYNVNYVSGACGCVSRNYPDKKWRIVCDDRDVDYTYPSRDAAARAERHIALVSCLTDEGRARHGLPPRKLKAA